MIHATVTRPYSHSSQDAQSKYRSLNELTEEATRDPILRLERELIEGGVLTSAEAAEIRESVRALVAEIGQEVLEARRPDPATVTDHVLSLPALPEPKPPPSAVSGTQGEGVDDAKPIGMGEAIRLVLFEQMEADERIRVFGEDVADASEDIIAFVEGKGGVFGTTHGLQREFGLARCYNTPLAEANIVGRGIGQAIRGLRPCAEIQFFDYIWPAMMQIRDELSVIRWRSNNVFSCPVVIRVAIGGYLTGGAIYHSQCGESMLTHMPGLRVVFPSNALDAAGLLRTAIRCDDPVLFLEHKRLYRETYGRAPYPGPEYMVPFGKAKIVNPGTDLTVITYGAVVPRALQAAQKIEREHGVKVELIDLRCLNPFDWEAIAASVAKTNRALVAYEDTLSWGYGAEIAARIADQLFDHLDAPIRRVAAADTFVAYQPILEDAILPQPNDLFRAMKELAEY